MRPLLRRARLTLAATSLCLPLSLSACGSDEVAGDDGEGTGLDGDDIELGELGADDLKADGNWGAATTCKAIPNLPKLKDPRITVSLNGLTLHLVDPETGYDKVFPIGPGTINTNAGETTSGESRSLFPVLSQGKQDFSITPATSTACKIWWTDKATGETLPVFAGLPFLSFSGPYAIHGPVDNYRAANGGNLRRGFVSHGCIRMRAEDVLEVYARIKGLAKVPVHLQREPERSAEGVRVDVPDPWLGAECVEDSDCVDPSLTCKTNPLSERGFCTKTCTSLCPDKTGYPTSFCVADPEAPTKGICVLKENSTNLGCRPLDHFTPQTQKRFGTSTTTAKVCLPGSPGWIGDQCLDASDCQSGNTCFGATATEAGVCTRACTGSCPDQAGTPLTYCVNDPALGGSMCARSCTPASNASECPAGSACVTRKQVGSTKSRSVCVPE
ncbi:MAG: L,D-transpeptidase [Myxococcales bacterium]|nr:L,D-transpeptidase [Myxococcales bacterium]